MFAAMNVNATNGTACDAFDSDQQKALAGLRGAVGGVCLIVVAIALILFIVGIDRQPCKDFRRRILLFLTASALLYLVVFTMQISAIGKGSIVDDNNIRLCKAIGFLTQYFGWQQLLLVSSITVYMHFYYVQHKDIFGPIPHTDPEVVPIKAKVGEAMLFLTLVLVPVGPAGLGFINDGYGESRGWCWFQSRDDSDCKALLGGILRQIFLWYIWCVVCGIVTLVILFKIIYTMQSHAEHHSGGTTDSIANNFRKREGEGVILLIFLGIFHIVNFIELVGAIISYAVADNLFALWAIYAVLSPLTAAAIPTAFWMVICCCYHEDIKSPCCSNDLDANNLDAGDLQFTQEDTPP